MWLLRTALRRPFTIIVAVIGIALCSILALVRMPIDIFPNLNLPVVYVAQPYGGMSPAQMEGYLVYYYEYHFLYITGIESVESKSIQNVGLLKLTFPSRHRREPGSRSNDLVCGSGTSIHATGNGSTVCDALRRGQRAGRVSCVFESDARSGRDSGSCLESRTSTVCDSPRCFSSSTVWGEPTYDCDHCRSGSIARLPHVPRGSGESGECGQHHHAGWQYPRRRPAADGTDKLGGQQHSRVE